MNVSAPSLNTGAGRPGLPLHARISADLAGMIRSGAWPPGWRIPFEHELMSQYGCARATAGKAVQALADAGLIERRRRAGSFVARPPIQTAVLEIPELQAEVTARGQAYGWTLIGRCERGADRGRPDEAMLGEAGPCLEIEGLHLADGRPFALESRIISLDAAPEARDADFAAVSPGGWLLGHVAWSEGEHRIGAAGADRAQSAHLGLRAGAPCLSLRRWTWRQGRGVTFVRLLFPADAFELAARFAPRTFAPRTFGPVDDKAQGG